WAVGLLGFLYFRIIDPEERGSPSFYRVVGAVGGGAVLGAGLSTLLGVSKTMGWDWAGVVVAVVFAFAMYSLRARTNLEPCVLCKTPASGTGFRCPRCGDPVCARPTCWNAKY